MSKAYSSLLLQSKHGELGISITDTVISMERSVTWTSFYQAKISYNQHSDLIVIEREVQKERYRNTQGKIWSLIRSKIYLFHKP